MKDDVFVSDNWRNIIWNNRLNEIIDSRPLECAFTPNNQHINI